MTHPAALAVICLLALSACAATAPAPDAGAMQSPQQARAAALSALLLETAETAPHRITAVEPEMTALRQALNTASLADARGAAPDAPDRASSDRAAPAPGPAPDLSSARSIMSGVHLASYRHAENAEAGWRALQASAPDALPGLQARVSRADLGERGVYLRLKAGPLDSAQDARALCARLEQAGMWCAPSDFNGEALTQQR